MKFNHTYLNSLNYFKINTKELILEELNSEVACRLNTQQYLLTEVALKQLCSVLKIPYAFTKQLREQNSIHILMYIQQHLAQISSTYVYLVYDAENIVSITNESNLFSFGKEVMQLDTTLNAFLNTSDSLLEKGDALFDNDLLTYFLFYKEAHAVEAESSWKWGFYLTVSVLGTLEPKIGVVVYREADMCHAILPPKDFSYTLASDTTFDAKLVALTTFLQSPPVANWVMLKNSIAKVKKVTASFREVRLAKNKLAKIVTDDKLDDALMWSLIKKEYNIKDLGYKPNSNWYSKATTPLTIFDLFTYVAAQATAAPSDTLFDIRQALYIYAGELLVGTLDFYNVPPDIRWP